MMLPFTLPSMRNVQVTCSVPSSVTPWSINPVHFSLEPPTFFDEPNHFKAIPHPRSLFHFSCTSAQVNAATQASCRIMRQHGRPGSACEQRNGSLHQAIVNAHQL